MGNAQTITVEATGTASAPPDIARLRLFTFAEDPEPGDALTTCSLLAERVLAALKAAGIASSDLETTSIELNQHQHQRRDGEETVSSYRASTGLDAMVRPPEEVGRMVARAVEAAGTGVQIREVTFDVEDRAPLASLARRDAVARAMRAARELAEAAGVELGALVELHEGVGRHLPFGSARPLSGGRAMAAMAPPVELGGLSAAVTVTAVFEASSGVPA